MPDSRPLHSPVRRWRTGFLRVWCSCGLEVYPCPTLIAQKRHQAATDEARHTSGYEDTVNNWWENPR
jgi:hypothetical protein